MTKEMNPKVLIAIVVVLVVLFVVGMGAGIGQNDEGEQDLSPDWVEAAGSLLVEERPLTADDVSAASPPACRQQLAQGQFLLGQGGACVLVIGEISSSPFRAIVRTLPLVLAVGGEAEVRLEPGDEDSLTVEQRLEGSRRDTVLRIFEAGGSVQITCLSGGGVAGCALLAR